MLELWKSETGEKAHIAKPGTRSTHCGKKMTHGWEMVMEVPNLHHAAEVCQRCARAAT